MKLGWILYRKTVMVSMLARSMILFGDRLQMIRFIAPLLPIENYKEIIDKPYYYIDKTLLIGEILDKGGKVNLFTRPRRFGKNLALSMIKTFFEQDTDIHGDITDNSHYFDGMKICQAGEGYTQYMGQYPVISLSLKSAKQAGL